ncbi:MAG: CHAT domain-containing protein [Pseudomonadales bacterium]
MILNRVGNCRVSAITLILSLLVCNGSFAKHHSETLQQAESARAKGNYQRALTLLNDTLSNDHHSQSVTDTVRVDAQLLRIDLLRSLGRLTDASEALSALSASAGGTEILKSQAQELQHQLALLQYAKGDVIASDTAIDSILDDIESMNQDRKAAVLNDKGLVTQRLGDLPGAAKYFARAVEAAPAEQTSVVVKYQINQARALMNDGELISATKLLDTIAETLTSKSIPMAASHRVALAGLFRQGVNEFGADQSYRLKAFNQLQTARTEVPVENRKLASYIFGYLGALYEDEGRYEAALSYSRKAVFEAQQVQADDVLFRWEWQLGRTLSALAQQEESVAAYKRAIEALRNIRTDLEATSPGAFQQIVSPVFYQYADVLLGRSANMPAGQQKQQLLRQVRDALEEVKLAEVEDYLDNQCIVAAAAELDQLDLEAAVLYPVLLEDRIELLLTTPEGIAQYSVPISRIELTDVVRDFRLNIEVDTGTRKYFEYAQQLYGWLIAPIVGQLERNAIKTLVIIPDGPLRTIPLAALHDGSNFLIEKYALATTPGLTLIDPKPIASQSYSAMVGGISDAVQGFSALPSVNQELQVLQRSLNAEIWLNESFTLANVQTGLEAGNYSVAHFATHGQFRGSYSESFLLTHDTKMTLDMLGSSIQARAIDATPLELLVLSACETAAGDDRAALGLAGVAIKAGARSALASLWAVNDAATAELITSFYDTLNKRQDSKAGSLKQAQMELISNSEFAHPSNWAPFLMIGNWL